MASIKSKSTSKRLGASPTRVFVDVTPPRHQGPRLSLADVDIDASKSSKLASLSSKTSSKALAGLSAGSAKRAGKDGRALKPTTRTNSSTSVKRGREDDTDEKEGLKKRKVEQKKTADVDKISNKPSARGGAKKLDTTTVAPTVADSSELLKKVVVKKPVPEPQPLWTRVGVAFTREEIENRILLREFTLRFNQCLGLKRPVLEKLEDFGDFDDATAKALLLATIDVIRQDAPSNERRILADFIKQLRAKGMSVYDILYTMHHKLRNSTSLHIPNLTGVLKEGQGKKGEDIDSTALIPVILGLIDDILETDIARKEVDRWKEEGAEVRRNYHKAMKEEKEHWAPLRVKLMDEKKVGGAGFDLAKWKKKFEAAKSKHDGKEHNLKFNFIKNLAEISQRFSPLVDMDGRTYYIHTPSLRKPPAKSTRDDYGKWPWFVAVWGARPNSAKRIDDETEGDDSDKVDDSGSVSSELTDPEESEDEISGAKEARDAIAHKRAQAAAAQEGWWGFGEAAEVKLLAKWLQWRDLEAGGHASPDGSADGDEDGTPDAEDDDEAKPGDGSKRLVAALLDFATVLQYADDAIAK